jgi:hypothetical protein
MGAEISTLFIQPALLGIAVALMIYAEIKYDEKTTNKVLVGVAIALNILVIILGFIMALLV